MNFKLYWQLEKKDCGPTCLRMILKYYGISITLNQVRALCETSKLGTSMGELKNATDKLGFKSVVARGSNKNLTIAQTPAILYWKSKHFVVIYNIKFKKNKRYFYIADPSFGKIKLSEDEFEQRWENEGKGFILLLEPTDRLYNLNVEKTQKANMFVQLWKMYKGFITRYKSKISLALILTFLGMICSWFIPFFFKQIVDIGIIGKQFSVIGWLLFFQFIVIFSNFLARTFSSILLMKVNYKIGVEVLTDYLLKIIRLPVAIFDLKQSSDFIVKLFDISRIQNFLSQGGISLFLQIVNFVVFASILIYFNIIVFLLVFGLVIAGIFWTISFMKKRKRIDYELTRLETENTLTLQELITEMPEVKINSAQYTKVNQWSEIYTKQAKATLASLNLSYWQTGGTNFFTIMASLSATGLCAFFVIHDVMTLGIMMSIGFIVGQLTSPMEQIVYLLKGFQEVSISNERVQEVFDYKEENSDRKEKFEHLTKGISLKDLSFKYNGSRSPFVLKNIDLFLPKNSITAIVGMSGSGKTTLLRLLLGFYKPTEGCILMDKKDLGTIDLENYREHIGVVMQDGHIFSNTIAENIGMSDLDPNIDQVKKVSKVACLDKFIESLPLKYKTPIGKNGIELSGGQKQRILIARALYNNPQILLLDEATSALDANTEKAIVKNLNAEMKNKTVIIIAHRFSTIKSSDQIVVLQDGIIVEIGNHSLLTESKGEYFNLVRNQLEI